MTKRKLLMFAIAKGPQSNDTYALIISPGMNLDVIRKVWLNALEHAVLLKASRVQGQS